MHVFHIDTGHGSIVLDSRQDYSNYDFVDKIEYNIALTGWVKIFFAPLILSNLKQKQKKTLSKCKIYMLPVSLDCLFMIAPSDLSNIYYISTGFFSQELTKV